MTAKAMTARYLGTAHMTQYDMKYIALCMQLVSVFRHCSRKRPEAGSRMQAGQLTWPLLARTCSPLASEQAKTALHAIGTDCFGPTYQSKAAFWTTKNVLKPAV